MGMSKNLSSYTRLLEGLNSMKQGHYVKYVVGQIGVHVPEINPRSAKSITRYSLILGILTTVPGAPDTGITQ